MKILRLPEVMVMTGLSKSTIYLWIGKEKFPAHISLGARSIGWIEQEVEEWIESRIAESRMIDKR